MRRQIFFLVSLLIAQVVAAETISYSGNFGTSAAELSISAFPVAVSLPKFDSTLGTLTGISLNLVAQGSTAVVQVYNRTNSPQGFLNATTTLDLSLVGPNGVNVEVTPTAGPFSGFAPPGFSDVGTATIGAVANTAVVAPANFAAYAGTSPGTFALTLSGFATSSGTAAVPGTVFFGGDGTTYGSFGVTYTYTPIPEPAFFGLVAASAALGMVGWRRRLYSS